MRIGICDDNVLWYKNAKKIIYDHLEKLNIDSEFHYFSNRGELENYDGNPLDVLFMDIVLEPKKKRQTGIDIISSINQKWKGCQIVYLTNYITYATDVYHTDHVFFVLKNQFEQRIGEVFHKILHELSQNRDHLVFSVTGSKEISLVPADIFYFERSLRITSIVTVYGTYDTRMKLSDLMEILPAADFVRCHNSYIVYLPAVREMYANEFILTNGTKINISRKYRQSTKDAFMRWALSQIS